MRIFIQHSNEIAIHIKILESSIIQWKQQATLVSLNRIWPTFVWTCLWPRKKKLFFVELWHVCSTKRCVQKFFGDKINEIYSGITSCVDVTVMPHCSTGQNKHAIKLMMQSTDAVYDVQHSLARPFSSNFSLPIQISQFACLPDLQVFRGFE